MSRSPVPRAGAQAFHSRDQVLSARALPEISRLRGASSHLSDLSISISGRSFHDRPRSLAAVRGGKPRGLCRHVSVLGAEGVTPGAGKVACTLARADGHRQTLSSLCSSYTDAAQIRLCMVSAVSI